jgi:hypothetical protein
VEDSAKDLAFTPRGTELALTPLLDFIAAVGFKKILRRRKSEKVF